MQAAVRRARNEKRCADVKVTHNNPSTHGDFDGLGFHWELEMHAMGGVPEWEILRAATINGAEAIGFARDIGSIEVGKLADLQVLDRNPLDDIANTLSIRYVMKNGRLYEGDTLREIWPREVEAPALWWW